MSTRWPDPTTIRSPPTDGSTLTRGVGPGAGPTDGRGLGRLPGVLDRVVADDRLVDVEPAVDDVEQHGLAGDDVDDRRLERPVAGDDVDLARRGRRSRARSAASAERRPASQAATTRAAATTQAQRRAAARTVGNARRESRARPADRPARRARARLDTGARRTAQCGIGRAGRGDDPSRPAPAGRLAPDPDRGPDWPYPSPTAVPADPGPAPASGRVDRAPVPAVRLEGLTKVFGNDAAGQARRPRRSRPRPARASFTAVDHVDLEVRDGEFFSMLGPSGSGKTTTLRMIAGFELPTEGRILLHGEDVSRKPPFERDVNTVFQDYALFPHMTVGENVEYGLARQEGPQGRAPAARRRGAPDGPPRGLRQAQARRSSPAASGSASRSPGRSSTGPASCSSTSRSARST